MQKVGWKSSLCENPALKPQKKKEKKKVTSYDTGHRPHESTNTYIHLFLLNVGTHSRTVGFVINVT
jgi:hypothetical protein